MKVNELRVDNFILFKLHGTGKGKIGQMKRGDFGRFNDEEYHPVHITPKWLERCGFEDGWLTFKDGSQLVVHKDGTATIGGWDSATSSQSVEVPCAYLHQLQNLYFTLTGEELNVRL